MKGADVQVEKNICGECARSRGLSCCESVEIYVTPGDIKRISSFTNSTEFYVAAAMKGIYRNCDPAWKDLILDANRRRNIIRLTKNGQCVFLKKEGCQLPMTVKPLLCRLHPYDFNEQGITGIYRYCPIAKLPNGEDVLRDMGMSSKMVKKWHATLYRELRAGKQDRGSRCATNKSRSDRSKL